MISFLTCFAKVTKTFWSGTGRLRWSNMFFYLLFWKKRNEWWCNERHFSPNLSNSGNRFLYLQHWAWSHCQIVPRAGTKSEDSKKQEYYHTITTLSCFVCACVCACVRFYTLKPQQISWLFHGTYKYHEFSMVFTILSEILNCYP